MSGITWFDQLVKQRQRFTELQNSWQDLAKAAVENGKALAGIWMGETKIYLVTGDYLAKLGDKTID